MSDAATPTRKVVVHVTLSLEVGGLEKLLVEFARHTDRSRFLLHFVVMGDRGILADDIERQGWPVTALHEPFGLRLSLLWKLRSLFKRLHADVVHTHDDRPHLYGAAAARLAGVRRVIHTRHGLGLGMTSRQNFLMRLASRLTNHYVCVSEDSLRHTLGVGVSPQRLMTILNGIDLERFDYTGPDINGPVVSVARLSPEKDMATLLRATAIARRQRPDFRVEIAGEGAMMPHLRQLASDLALGDSVKFLGQVNDVPGLLMRARLFTLASLSEGVSLTILEAMARGLPVVTTAVGGNPEVVADGDTGLLVSSAAPEELATALLRVYESPHEARTMGLAGRRRVESRFDVRRMVRDYERLYQGLPPLPTSEPRIPGSISI
jgi:glycosyltransferase involved in cell wall biosynthesis